VQIKTAIETFALGFEQDSASLCRHSHGVWFASISAADTTALVVFPTLFTKLDRTPLLPSTSGAEVAAKRLALGLSPSVIGAVGASRIASRIRPTNPRKIPHCRNHFALPALGWLRSFCGLAPNACCYQQGGEACHKPCSAYPDTCNRRLIEGAFSTG
jgi:hypothetical protein